MTDTTAIRPPKLSRSARLGLAMVGTGAGVLIAIAVWLQPDPTGQGTHRQLGLPPCTFVQLFDLRCPSCGMTTAWAHVVRGNFLAGLRSNVGGTLLCLFAALMAPWALWSSASGRLIWRLPSDMAMVAGSIVMVVLILVDWAIRLAAG